MGDVDHAHGLRRDRTRLFRRGTRGPAIGAGALAPVTTRLARRRCTRSAGGAGGADRSRARGVGVRRIRLRRGWNSLYDGQRHRLSGLEVTLALVGAALVAPLASRWWSAAGRDHGAGIGLAAGAMALGMTKFPSEVPDDWGWDWFRDPDMDGAPVRRRDLDRGLAGLLLLALPGGVPETARGALSGAIRRFSVLAMSCVAAIVLSGSFLYWGHVTVLAAVHHDVRPGAGREDPHFRHHAAAGVEPFLPHPPASRLRRAGGDERRLRTILLRQFPALLAVEPPLGMTVLLLRPSCMAWPVTRPSRPETAAHATSVSAELPKIPAKQAQRIHLDVGNRRDSSRHRRHGRAVTARRDASPGAGPRRPPSRAENPTTSSAYSRRSGAPRRWRARLSAHASPMPGVACSSGQ